MHWQENTKVVSIDGYQVVQSNNEYALMKAVAEQPIAAFVSGYEPEFQKYQKVSFFPFNLILFCEGLNTVFVNTFK